MYAGNAACQAAATWPAHVTLAVNLSPDELRGRTTPETIATVLRETGFDGTRLEIEITEQALTDDDPGPVQDILRHMGAEGVSVALDDFGTGFSSLQHLRELPFDKLKIDRAFIRNLDRDPENVRYVIAIAGLGHALGLQVTAEGIESEGALEALRAMGCAYGQGNLFSPPMPSPGPARLTWRRERPVA